MSEPRTFTCLECGGLVCSFMPETDFYESDLCLTCTFLLSIEDPDERELVRAQLRKGGEL